MRKVRDNKDKSLDIERAYNSRKYIVAYRTVYQPHYSINAGYYAMPIYYNTTGNMTQRGRFYHLDNKEVNRLVGFELVRPL